MCLGIFLARIYVHRVCSWGPWESEEYIRSPELELGMVLYHHVGAGN